MKTFKIIDLIIKVIWSIVCIFFIIILIIDIIDISNNSSNYPIGTSSPWWSYRSISNYYIHGIILIVWFLLGILPLILLKRIKISDYTFIIHLLATLSYMIYNFNSFNDW